MNSVYYEVGANGQSFFSVNYDRFLYINKDTSLFFLGRGGISLLTNKYTQKRIFGLPIEGIVLYGGRKHYIEGGIGWTPFLGISNLNDTLIPPDHKTNSRHGYFFRIGYRFIAPSGATVRIAPYMLYFLSGFPDRTKYERIVTLGFSIGYNF